MLSISLTPPLPIAAKAASQTMAALGHAPKTLADSSNGPNLGWSGASRTAVPVTADLSTGPVAPKSSPAEPPTILQMKLAELRLAAQAAAQEMPPEKASEDLRGAFATGYVAN